MYTFLTKSPHLLHHLHDNHTSTNDAAHRQWMQSHDPVVKYHLREISVLLEFVTKFCSFADDAFVYSDNCTVGG